MKVMLSKMVGSTLLATPVALALPFSAGLLPGAAVLVGAVVLYPMAFSLLHADSNASAQGAA